MAEFMESTYIDRRNKNNLTFLKNALNKFKNGKKREEKKSPVTEDEEEKHDSQKTMECDTFT